MSDLKKSAPEAPKYTIVRDSIIYERIWYLEYRLGIRSNVVVAATYNHPSGQALTKPMVLRALKTVIEQQPSMRLVGVPVTKQDKQGKETTGLMMAALNEINVEESVQFKEGQGITEEMIEKLHNQWDFGEPDKPWFKLVVSGSTVYYVNHHAINDGMSGYIFHRTFTAALNAAGANSSTDGVTTWSSTYDPSTMAITPSLHSVVQQGEAKGKPWQVNVWEVIKPVLTAWLLYMFVPSWLVFSDLPSVKPKPHTASTVIEASDRGVTRTVLRRIPAETMDKLVAKCRENGTSVTALLMTMLTASIINDYYSDKTFLLSVISVDIRNRLPDDMIALENKTMGNRAGGVYSFQKTGKYKGLFPSGQDKLGEQSSTLKTDEIWARARDAKQWMHAGLDPAARTIRASAEQPNDLDAVAKTLTAGEAMKPAYNLGNLGPYVSEKSQDGWTVEDVAFSGPPQGGIGGPRPPLFQVGGVKGGNTHIATNWQDGGMPREKIEGIVDGTLRRIEQLVIS
ncbi:alcohol acetyltransferase [Emericellopsis atlantica]|uniref:Alcohol acetyltransferase n=1 Tax=Emericellopsis atlantica TaxID=2614577 RepID=A0A9P7ZRS3_9HYPO|nr:alcohol acetyltransferase [Emericellopsis atlantica]KAG9256657.1 alcohol acetyltransferase [Emericellopsis atlantica]